MTRVSKLKATRVKKKQEKAASAEIPSAPFIKAKTEISKATDQKATRYSLAAVQSRKMEHDMVLLSATDSRMLAFVPAEGNSDCDGIPGQLVKPKATVHKDGKNWFSSSGTYHKELDHIKHPDVSAVAGIVQTEGATVVCLDVDLLMNLALAISGKPGKWRRQTVCLIIENPELENPSGAIGVLPGDEFNTDGSGILMCKTLGRQPDETDEDAKKRIISVWEARCKRACELYSKK